MGRKDYEVLAVEDAPKVLVKERQDDFTIYADGHIFFNRPELVRWDEYKDRLMLTDWAVCRVDQCCLRFVRHYVQRNIGEYYYGRMSYDDDYVKQCERYLAETIRNSSTAKNLADAQYEYEMNYSYDFKLEFEKLMRMNEETQETIVEVLHITSRRLRDWLKEPERFFKKDNIIMIALTWKLPGFITELLLESLDIQI